MDRYFKWGIVAFILPAFILFHSTNIVETVDARPALTLYYSIADIHLERESDEASRRVGFNLYFIDENWLDVNDFWEPLVGDGNAAIAMICWIVALLAGIVAIILHFIANREPAGLLYVVAGLVNLVSLYLWWDYQDQYLPIPVGALILLYVGFRVYQGER